MKTRRRRTKRGGSKYYYPYNKHPILFTNVSNKRYGGNSKYSYETSGDIGYQVNSLYNTSMGRYPPVNPSPLSQNLIRY
jgi:hypothetical protein